MFRYIKLQKAVEGKTHPPSVTRVMSQLKIKKMAEGMSLYDWHKEMAMYAAMVESAFGRSLFGFALDALIHQRSLSRSGWRDPHTRSGGEGKNCKSTIS